MAIHTDSLDPVLCLWLWSWRSLWGWAWMVQIVPCLLPPRLVRPRQSGAAAGSWGPIQLPLCVRCRGLRRPELWKKKSLSPPGRRCRLFHLPSGLGCSPALGVMAVGPRPAGRGQPEQGSQSAPSPLRVPAVFLLLPGVGTELSTLLWSPPVPSAVHACWASWQPT